MFLTNDLERPNKIDERIPLQMNKPIIHSSEPKACHSKSFNNPSKGDEGPLIFEDDFKKDAAEQKTRKPYDAIVMVGYEMLNEFRSKMTDENNSNNEIHNCSKILEGSEKKSTNNNFNFAPGICEFAFNDKMEIEQDKPFNMGQQCSASALLQTSDSLSSYKSTGSLATSISSGLSHSSSSSSQALDQHVLDGIIHWKPSQFAQQQICSDSVCIIEGKRVSTYLEVQKKQMMENWKKQEIEMKKKIEELCLKIHDGKEEKCAMEQFGDEYHSQAPKTENKSDCLSDVSEIQLLQRKKQEKIVETYKRKMLRKRVKEAIRFWRMFDVWVKNDWFAERGIVEGDAETYEEQELWEAAESEELGRMRKPAKFEWAEDRDTEGVTLEEMKNYLKGVDENGACDKSESLEILIRRAEDSIKKEIERNEKSCVERCFEIKQKRLLRKTGTSIKWKNVNTLMGESTGSNERDKNVVAINKFDTENADATKPNELDKQMDRGMLYQSSVADLHLNEDLNIKGLVTRDAGCYGDFFCLMITHANMST
ncbi:uncharacterized protein MONOS_10581 [Monocercomonoides exilis]|uniref:uncharacterized protein n=1 Tax=Monocercomonoides exilis TaxID=2049356 RepID=UPI00355A9425|nr:hypothetical protein MONOS_10581 [Monocercomonoides exilis]|eukprot:MONOS_10581.1-p1 / transcript=MONOS_10581.1 / gene=MONOS_10581 / organism=Monocercomonoides_exilis_PA203 / gene_product=unspecified product / transcript_product=unspecified product / location=Mono_scaffold00486:31114-32872(+) / protein_length=538 / sequence_SO=supercontig / SO=protein_coding / is_pseudo=false